jgi:hypothetical protein
VIIPIFYPLYTNHYVVKRKLFYRRITNAMSIDVPSCLRFYRPLYFVRSSFSLLDLTVQHSSFMNRSSYYYAFVKEATLEFYLNVRMLSKFAPSCLACFHHATSQFSPYYIDIIAGHRTPCRISRIYKLSYRRCNSFSASSFVSVPNMLNLPPFLCSITNITIIKLRF